jgi:uncharacterized membrane protein
MITPLAIPLDLPADGVEQGEAGFGLLEPLLGVGAVVLLLALALLAFFLVRNGRPLPRPTLPTQWFTRPAGPEETAKRILAERLAQGDLSPEEFMERASTLNWTPGEVHVPRRTGRG